MSSKASAKPRIQRLRASCDGCFLAKVKCSKARPICSRCLTCGTDCKYSPSSRAGKPKASRPINTSSMALNIANPNAMIDSGLSSPYMFDSHAIAMAPNAKGTPMFSFNTNWSVSIGSPDEGFRGSLSSTSASSLGDEAFFDTSDFGMPSSTSEIFDPSSTWISSAQDDFENSILYPTGQGIDIPRSRSVGDVTHVNAFSPWNDGHLPNPQFPAHASAGMTAPTSFTSSTPSANNAEFPRVPSSPCNCFTTCLQSLQALHNHSTTTNSQQAFEVVLSINRKAVEGCASMLACRNCSSGSNTTTMLLATIIEKVLSTYQLATQGHAHGSHSDGEWVKHEVIWRELRKLEELLDHFQDVCGDWSNLEDNGVQSSLLGHLVRSLSFTFELHKLQQSGYGQ